MKQHKWLWETVQCPEVFWLELTGLQQGEGQQLEGLELKFKPTAVSECVSKKAPDAVVRAQLNAEYK